MDSEKLEQHAEQLIGFISGYQLSGGFKVIEIKMSQLGVIVELDGHRKTASPAEVKELQEHIKLFAQ